MIKSPSQYQINNMKKGDIIYVTKRHVIYMLLRKYISKNKIKVRVPVSPGSTVYKEKYQEDCVLIHDYEVKCNQTLENSVPYFIKKSKFSGFTQNTFKKVIINLENIRFILPDNTIIQLPVQDIDRTIQKNKTILKELQDTDLIEDNIKYLKYKGDYFRDKVLNNNIKQWNMSYCPVCGNPVKLKFKKDSIDVINKCSCGNISINLNNITYDNLSVIYASQIDKYTKAKFDKFWFDKE